MYSQSLLEENRTGLTSISVKDLLDECCGKNLSEYLSLSVTDQDGNLHICLTTTHGNPVTYATVIPALSNIDLQSLVFVIQD